MKRHYGYIPDLMDFRDRPFRLAAPVPLPPVVDLRSGMPPVYNQGDIGSCTANAIAAAIEFDRCKQGKPFMFPSRLFIYWNEREMEGTIDSDAGAMIRDGIKSVADDGVCSETDWPYDISKFQLPPVNSCYGSAEKNQVLSYERVAPDLYSMLQCLAGGFPFVFGFSVYESFESAQVSQNGIIPMPALTESQLGGHAVIAVGYDQSKEAFLVRNSWGDTWGIGGYCWMPEDYLANPDLCDDRWVIKLVET